MRPSRTESNDWFRADGNIDTKDGGSCRSFCRFAVLFHVDALATCCACDEPNYFASTSVEWYFIERCSVTI